MRQEQQHETEALDDQCSYACIGIGSNIGDREQFLRQAVQALDADPDVSVVNCSALYETEPVGYVEQDAFLNIAVVVRTSLAPHALHHLMQAIEADLGRVREVRFGPRTIDLDLLLVDDRCIDDETLTVPHPRMWERAFVLIPLLDAVGQLRPAWSAMIVKHLETLQGKEGVTYWSNFNWRSASEPFAN